MQGVADWWDGVAHWFGYREWVWGSAADWVAAIGALAAFSFALYLAWDEVRRSRRSQADKVATWMSHRQNSETGDWDTFVEVYNASEVPLLDAKIIAEPTFGDVYVTMAKEKKGFVGVRPGQRITRRIPRTKRPQALPVYIRLTDASATTRVRDLRTNEYVTG